MSRNTAPTPIIQRSIPVRYDPRVVVKHCKPNRVPRLPFDVLYLIAEALPQPKQVFNLALASKGTWEGLQRALYECEVTYEARLAHKYRGQSSICLEQEFPDRIRDGVEYADAITESSDGDSTASDWSSSDTNNDEGESDEQDGEDASPEGEPDEQNVEI